MTQGKIPNKERIRIICRYANGGVPLEFSFETLTNLVKNEQKQYSVLRLKKMEAETI